MRVKVVHWCLVVMMSVTLSGLGEATAETAAERDQHRRHLPHLIRNAELDLLAAALDRLGALLRGGQACLHEADPPRSH